MNIYVCLFFIIKRKTIILLFPSIFIKHMYIYILYFMNNGKNPWWSREKKMIGGNSIISVIVTYFIINFLSVITTPLSYTNRIYITSHPPIYIIYISKVSHHHRVSYDGQATILI